MSTTDKVSIDTRKLFILRDKLSRKAKQEPEFRFYSLYCHVYREDTLWEAWRRVKRNKGSPGLDGISFNQIEESQGGVFGFLEGIRLSLQAKTYNPSSLKRVYIDKPDGGKRLLAIPTITDRVVQMACLLILEPIFEADFEDCSYGFRPGRSAKDAVAEIQRNVNAGLTGVYDADIKGYFDNIDHQKLIGLLEQRIADRSILHLIRLWLRCPVVEVDKCSGKKRYTYPKKGSPQGGVISPLLANIYLHELDRRLHGPEGKLSQFNARLVRYADDFVILARFIGFEIEAMVRHIIETLLGLTLHPRKTRILNLKQPGSRLDFLSFSFRFDRDLHGRDHTYLNIFPSEKAFAKVQNDLRAITRSSNKLPIKKVIGQVNQVCKGWSTYFNYGYPRKVFRALNWYAQRRLIGFLKRRSQRPPRRRTDESWYLYLRRKGFKAI